MDTFSSILYHVVEMESVWVTVPPINCPSWQAHAVCCCERSPFFVTLDKRGARGQYDLRGCIGTLSPRPLTDLGPWALKR